MDMRFKTEGTRVKVVSAGTLGMPAPSKLENHDYMGDLAWIWVRFRPPRKCRRTLGAI